MGSDRDEPGRSMAGFGALVSLQAPRRSVSRVHASRRLLQTRQTPGPRARAVAAPTPPSDGAPVLTVVVPTRHEAGNVPELGRRLAAILPDRNVEVLFVDDSDDDTPHAIARVAERSPRTIRSVHRPPEERYGGLSGAVVEGLRHSNAAFACVMDGDLQHPPELIERMLERAEREELDVVVASRYCECGSAAGFGQARAFLSCASRIAVRVLFPHRLAAVSDPMSGFFLVRREALDLTTLKPRGFKVLLEVVGRSPALRIGEVPLCFGRRYNGTSKASLGQGASYLVQLLSLRCDASMRSLAALAELPATAIALNRILLAQRLDIRREAALNRAHER